MVSQGSRGGDGLTHPEHQRRLYFPPRTLPCRPRLARQAVPGLIRLTFSAGEDGDVGLGVNTRLGSYSPFRPLRVLHLPSKLQSDHPFTRL